MPPSPTATVPSSEPLQRSRSRGGSGADSSGHPGRRNPPATGPSLVGPTEDLLATASTTLRAHRDFRVQQLRELHLDGDDADPDAARREVRLALRTAAWSALHEIDAALGRIRGGHYGSCPTCGEALSVERLRALPMARLCGRCQQAVGSPGAGGDPSRSG
jgi:RNA polymerase-binding transcription factor DksA